MQLARRTPITFGNRWLKSLCVEYHFWVRQRTGDDIPEQDDLLRLLAALERVEMSRELWKHFSRRFGVLARCLVADGSGALVERFLDQLTRLKLHGLAVNIVQELAFSLGKKRFDRLARLANEGGREVQETVIWNLAYECCRNTTAATAVWNEIAEWLPGKGAELKSLSNAATVAIPAAILDILAGAVGKKEPERTNLADLLEARLDSGQRIEEVWAEILARPEFGAVAIRCMFDDASMAEVAESERRALGLSRALFQMALALPDTGRARVVTLGRAALAERRIHERTLIKAWWQSHADQISAQRGALPATRETAEQREHLLRTYRICRDLVRL